MKTTGNRALLHGSNTAADTDDAARLSYVRLVVDGAAADLAEELQQLRALALGGAEEVRAKPLADTIRAVQAAVLTLIGFGTKLDGLAPAGEVEPALDLEAARDEICSRLARLADRG